MTTTTRVVHCRKDDFDVYIGRSMPRYPELKAVGWGNPYKTAPGVDAMKAYRRWVLNQPQLLARLGELRGKRLGCWCAPKGGLRGNLAGKTCHGEILAALADLSPEAIEQIIASREQMQSEPKHTTLKVISLWQPWATLMAAGYKRVETRSWAPRGLKRGQLVAIHAAKRWTDEERALCEERPFAECLVAAAQRGLWSGMHPPLGCVVAIARFSHVAATSYDAPASMPRIDFDQMTDEEYAFGDYSYGRYAWVFSEVRPLEPIPLRGAQGLFDWTPSEDLRYLEPRNAAEAMVNHAT